MSFRVCLISLLVLVVACGGPNPAVEPDAGGTLPDAGEELTDGGELTPDAGEELPDAGEHTPDAGDELPDAGEQTPDAGEDTPDAGENTPDGGTSPVSHVVDNGGFEDWPGALPELWFGSKSNISTDAVQKDTTTPFEGVNALRLVNSSGTHRRFSTVAKSMPAGRYACTFQARGTGEVRNAFYDDDYSSYSAYTSLDTATWTELSYSFNLADDVFETFELIFSVRNTSGEHLLIDDVRCVRAAEPCDQVSCEVWERCVNATATCEPLAGRCNDAADCREWEACDQTHTCVVAQDRCTRHADCAGTPETPVCDLTTHLCVEGDPCAGVTCSHAATSCNPTSGVCELAEGACFTTLDCLGALPACDPATRRCVAADHPSNIIRNGGFEAWHNVNIPYQGQHLIPEYWYGIDNGLTDPGTEIKPSRLVPYTNAVYGGSTALQFVAPIQVAERFSLEKFDVPSGSYSCSYRVRGQGTIRHRSYSTGGWSVQTPFLAVDSDAWQPVFFRFNGNVRGWRLIFYPSRTDPSRDHLQIDDVVCTKD